MGTGRVPGLSADSCGPRIGTTRGPDLRVLARSNSATSSVRPSGRLGKSAADPSGHKRYARPPPVTVAARHGPLADDRQELPRQGRTVARELRTDIRTDLVGPSRIE